jgi:putative transposase
MYFEKYHLYHVYNQGNNKQKIFFKRENYLFFLKKVRAYILPYADIMAYCLMPNHFHFLMKVNHVERIIEGFAPSVLNQSIGIILRSYTSAINKQENRSGTLFRKETKARCLTEPQGLAKAWFNSEFGTFLNIDIPEKDYPQQCFNYIHQNPVKAGLADNPEDWEFSSAVDYAGKRSGTLVNKAVAFDEGLIYW